MRLQHHLLAQSELTLQITMDEARAAEQSDRSAAKIQRYQAAHSQASSLAAVNQQRDGEETSVGDDDDISRLRASQGNRWKVKPKASQSGCLSCSGNHLHSNCKFKTATCRRCGKISHLSYVCCATLPSSEMAGPPPFKQQACRRASKPSEKSHIINHAADSEKQSGH